MALDGTDHDALCCGNGLVLYGNARCDVSVQSSLGLEHTMKRLGWRGSWRLVDSANFSAIS